jgi:hypothetical protein
MAAISIRQDRSLKNERSMLARGASRARSRPLLLGLLLCIAWPLDRSEAGTRIYRCEQVGKPVLYSQFLCPASDHQALYQADPRNLIDIPELSPAETAALADLERALQQSRKAARRHRLSQFRQARTQAQAARARCTEAVDALKALRATKRKGYTATAADRLERESRRLEALKKANC